MAEIPRYRGPFREKQAARLLWRAGFGPKPGEARRLARKGLNGAVASLLDPPKARLVGPAPVDGDGLPIAPYDLSRLLRHGGDASGEAEAPAPLAGAG